MHRILKFTAILLFAMLSQQTGAIYVPYGTKNDFPSNDIVPDDIDYAGDKNIPDVSGFHKTNLYYKKIYVNPYYLIPYVDDVIEDRKPFVQVDRKDKIIDRIDRDDYYEQTKSKKSSTKKASYSKYAKAGDIKYVQTSDGKYVRVKDLSTVDNSNNNRFYKLKDTLKPVWEQQEDDVTQRTIYKFILPEPRIKKTWD